MKWLMCCALALGLSCRDPVGPFYRYATLCETVAAPGAPIVCRYVRCEIRDGRIDRATCVAP